jgi:hypothetical protein
MDLLRARQGVVAALCKGSDCTETLRRELSRRAAKYSAGQKRLQRADQFEARKPWRWSC